MNKSLIKSRFEKNIETYNNSAIVQKEIAEKLINYCSKNFYTNILEIGCGTGFLTKAICKNLEFYSYTANDIVPSCKKYIRNINPKINFVCEDIEKIILQTQEKYDLIISNAVFQWFDNIESFINLLITKLNKNGEIIFTTFGNENYLEFSKIMNIKLNYFSKDELNKMFEKYNCKVDDERKILNFSSPKEVLQHIKQTGVNAIVQTKWTKTDLKLFEEKYNKLCNNKPTLTYHPIYVRISM